MTDKEAMLWSARLWNAAVKVAETYVIMGDVIPHVEKLKNMALDEVKVEWELNDDDARYLFGDAVCVLCEQQDRLPVEYDSPMCQGCLGISIWDPNDILNKEDEGELGWNSYELPCADIHDSPFHKLNYHNPDLNNAQRLTYLTQIADGMVKLLKELEAEDDDS